MPHVFGPHPWPTSRLKRLASEDSGLMHVNVEQDVVHILEVGRLIGVTSSEVMKHINLAAPAYSQVLLTAAGLFSHKLHGTVTACVHAYMFMPVGMHAYMCICMCHGTIVGLSLYLCLSDPSLCWADYWSLCLSICSFVMHVCLPCRWAQSLWALTRISTTTRFSMRACVYERTLAACSSQPTWMLSHI